MGILGILAVLGGLLVLYIAIYNGLVSKGIAADTAWAQITVQLKRRHDLIPNIVETVKGYAKHEKETLENVIRARNAAVSAGTPGEKIAAEQQLSGSLRQLFALSEAYPDLKANQNFLQLQGELAATENQISQVRHTYNTTVAAYNTAIKQIPANIIASTAGFTAKPFFELSESERAAAETAPKISF